MRASRTMLGLVLACFLITFSGALAVEPPADPGEAVFCIFTDWNTDDGPANGEVQYDAPQVFTPYKLYFVLYFPEGCTQTLGGFEFSLRLDNAGNELVEGTHAVFSFADWCPGQGGATNFAVGSFNYIAGVNTPVPHNGDPVVILDADLLFVNLPSSSHVYMYLQEGTPSSEPGQMSYVDIGCPDEILRMLPNNAAHDLDTPVFAWSGAVAVEARTWTGVKALFTVRNR